MEIAFRVAVRITGLCVVLLWMIQVVQHATARIINGEIDTLHHADGHEWTANALVESSECAGISRDDG